MNGPLLAFYGDDFTGSADVMEVLQWAGLRTVLFLDPPSASRLEDFPGLKAFGVAGCSRSMSPGEMDAELRPVLQQLLASKVPAVHYKTCSTFDSSPTVGSIGKAMELGQQIFGSRVIPMVIAAPNLGRYQVFGNLFARSGLDSPPFRLDRHPTMRQHPITPMDESDLRLHLARQTSMPVELVDALQLEQGFDQEADWQQKQGACLFDALYPRHLSLVGQVLNDWISQPPTKFLVGSSGIEYALTAFWQESGSHSILQAHAVQRPALTATKQLLVVTGSCSPVNDRQIDWALQRGFTELPIATEKLADEDLCLQEQQRLVASALKALRQGENIILHSARGPDDPRVKRTAEALQAQGLSPQQIQTHSGRILGPRLGRMMTMILEQYPLSRAAVAGGDTSGHIARELGIEALEAIAPVAPGSPLCRIHSRNFTHGMEFFFKGGQVGKDDVWTRMLHGSQD